MTMHSTTLIVLSYVGTFIAGIVVGFFGVAKWINSVYR